MESLLLRKARVRFDRPTFPLETLERTIAGGFSRLKPLPKGARVAVAAGSRGIANIVRITRAVVQALQEMGLQPFIVPAMGSHGGATAEGQREVLATYGITEASMKCPIRSSMDVVEIDSTGLEHPLYTDAIAAAADAIVLVNRIKPHTDFHGTHESGLAKMAVIGLGKQRQAEVMHARGVRGLRDLMPKAGRHLLASGKIWAGVGIVENAYDETAMIEVLPAAEIFERERALLEIARRNMPRLPIDKIDVLLVREIGKNISGTGFDSGIIGRMKIPGETEPERPSIRAIAVFNLTEQSHGNAIGVGFADVITKKLFNQIDHDVTAANIVTATFIERGKIPLAMPTDAAAFSLALRTCHGVTLPAARVMCIRNTLHLDEIYVSAALEAELNGRADIEWVSGFEPAFDGDGSLRGWRSS